MNRRKLRRILRKTLNESEIYPRPQHPMIAQANADAASRRELEQAIVSAFFEYCTEAEGSEPFVEFEAAVAERLGISVGEVSVLCDKYMG